MARNERQLCEGLAEVRMARLHRGFWVVAAGCAFLCVLVSIAGWLQNAELRAEGIAGPFAGLEGGLLLAPFCAAVAAFYGWVFRRRYERLASEGELVLGKVIGEKSSWGAEFFPGRQMAAVRGLWSGAMTGLSGILPTVRLPCEFRAGGKTQRVPAALFADEEPLRDADGRVLLLVFKKRVWNFPSPTLICVGSRDPVAKEWLEVFDRLFSPEAVSVS